MHSAERWWRWSELAAWLVIAVAGMVTLTQAVEWPDTRVVAIAQSLTPYLGITLAVAAGMALWRRWHAAATTTVAIGVGLLALSGPVAFPTRQPPAATTAAGTTIASVNLLYTNDRVEEVADLLDDLAPDVIVLSEYTTSHESVFLAHPIVDRYPYRIGRAGSGPTGMTVWSRSPAVEGEPLPTYRVSRNVMIDGRDGPLRVVGVHVATPVDDVDGWRDDLNLIAGLGRGAREPTAVVGDLNATYWHPNFRDLLDAGFVDAHLANGRGFATSWPTDGLLPPFVQLDHALTAGGLVSTDVTNVDVPGSDHRGVVVTVAPAR